MSTDLDASGPSVAVNVASCIDGLYKALLSRAADEQGLATFSELLRTTSDVPAVVRAITAGGEFRNRLSERLDHELVRASLYHCHASFDPVEIIRRHAVPGLRARPEYLTNFLGVLINPDHFGSILTATRGLLEPLPIPANWHADMAEWAAALRAVDLARDRFVVLELGCGWGCWMNNTGVAARRAGLDVHLIGIEGDVGHVAFAHEATAANGFSPEQIDLHNGIAAAVGGVSLFPRQAQSGVSWGLEPIFDATDAQIAEARQSGAYDVLPMISVPELVRTHGKVDLLHVDIQGGEADLIERTLPELTKAVGYLVIGTHSRQIEGRLFDALINGGWTLEIERPAFLRLKDGGVVTTIDGVQGWRNHRLVS